MPAAPTAGLRTETVTSRENRWLRQFRAALRRGPIAEGLVGVEGAHLVAEALHAGLEVAAVLASPAGEHDLSALVPLLPAHTRLLRTSERLFASVSDTQTPQGVAALVRPRRASFDDLVRGLPLVVVLVGLQDPGNVGTTVRSAEAFGATGVATCASQRMGTANPFAPKALRASAGSVLRLPVLAGMSLPVLLAQLRATGVKLCAASARAGESPALVDLRGPLALLVGNEGAGLPPAVEGSAELLLRIPLAGQAGPVESLNAAVAASVLLYEIARQRQGEPAGQAEATR